MEEIEPSKKSNLLVKMDTWTGFGGNSALKKFHPISEDGHMDVPLEKE